MKKILIFLILTILFVPQSLAWEDYLFDNAESSPNSKQIKQIKDKKTRYCERVYLEAMRRRAFTKTEIRLCKKIFIRKILAEIEYKRKLRQQRNIY